MPPIDLVELGLLKERICLMCGGEIISKPNTAIYCSTNCRARAGHYRNFNKNKEKLKERSKRWKENHREYVAAYAKKWAEKNSEHRKKQRYINDRKRIAIIKAALELFPSLKETLNADD